MSTGTNKLTTSAMIVLTGWAIGALIMLLDPIFNIPLHYILLGVPFTPAVLMAFAIYAGSILEMLSAVRWKNKSTNWRLELIALPVLTSGWLYYTVIGVTGVYLGNEVMAYPVVIGFTNTLATIARLLLIRRFIKSTREAVKKLDSSELR